MRLSARLMAALGAVLMISTLSLSAGAVFVEERLKDPAQELKAREIADNIRCLVCQNQSIMDSNADLAKDLRAIVREQVAEGKSEEQILDFLVARYGDWVLLNPPLKARTVILWISPAVVFVVGGFFMFRFLRRKREDNLAEAGDSVKPLTKEEQAELQAVLTESDRTGGAA